MTCMKCWDILGEVMRSMENGKSMWKCARCRNVQEWGEDVVPGWIRSTIKEALCEGIIESNNFKNLERIVFENWRVVEAAKFTGA